jgi:uncharacterized oxidoreductase
MQTKTADELRSLVVRVLMAAGADEDNAARVAEALVSSNLAGVDTHGVWHLPLYVSQIRDGFVVPTARPETVKENDNTALVTGNWTFGFVAAKYAVDIAIRKAGEHGVAVVGAVRLGHIGRLGEYAEMAASHGMVSSVWASGYSEETPIAVPYGGRRPALSTNPISMGFPGGEEASMVLDFATTAAAASKVNLARNRGQQIPQGWLVDRDGNPTTDPATFQRGGGLLPFGGHKGYALMLADEVLGRVLTGSDDYAEADRGGEAMRHQAVTFMVLRADLFQPLAGFERRADELGRRMRSVPAAAGFDEVLVPGDLERRARETRGRDGIPVPDDVWKELTVLAEEMRLEP